jgi:translation initiation factor 2B subunit (eIF-2B alpha/beta/delta family)
LNMKQDENMDSEDILRGLREDTSSGASEIMRKTVEGLLFMSSRLGGQNPEQYLNTMIEFGKELISAQPSMAPVFNTVNNMLLTLELGFAHGSSTEELQQRVNSAAKDILGVSNKAMALINKEVSELIRDGQRVLTHSYSSTVIGALSSAKRGGKNFHVIVTESRPLFEGRRTARLLSDAGIEVTLIADMAAFDYLEGCHMVLTGCDSICHKGVVNKAGTRGLAVCASQYNVPFFIVSEKNKVLPARYLLEPQIPGMDPEEIWDDPGRVTVKNVYFDITPHGFIKGYITEDGIIDPAGVLGLITQAEVSKRLIEKLG